MAIKYYFDINTKEYLGKITGGETWVQGDIGNEGQFYFGTGSSSGITNGLTSSTVFDYSGRVTVTRPDDTEATLTLSQVADGTAGYYKLVDGDGWVVNVEGTVELNVQRYTSTETLSYGQATQQVEEGDPSPEEGFATKTELNAVDDKVDENTANKYNKDAIVTVSDDNRWEASEIGAPYEIDVTDDTILVSDDMEATYPAENYTVGDKARIYNSGLDEYGYWIVTKDPLVNTPVYSKEATDDAISAGSTSDRAYTDTEIDKIKDGTYTANKYNKDAIVTVSDDNRWEASEIGAPYEIDVTDDTILVSDDMEATYPIEAAYPAENYTVGDKARIYNSGLDEYGYWIVTKDPLVNTPVYSKEATDDAISAGSTSDRAYTDTEIDKIKDGTYVAKKAEQDENGNDISDHIESTANPHSVTATQVGLGNVDNTADTDKPISDDTQDALDLKEDVSNKKTDMASDSDDFYPTVKAVNRELEDKADLVGGLVPSSQLPSYVDDSLEFDTYADLPTTGEAGIIYVVIADETSGGNTSTYRWASTVYVKISDTLSASEVKTLYESNSDTNAYTDAEKAKVANVPSDTNTEFDKLKDRIKCNVVSQSGSEFYRTAEDTTLTTGRKECVDISGIVTGTGLITYSIDNNTTKKPVVDTDGNQLNLATIRDRGIYIMGVYDGTNWVIVGASDDFKVLLQKTSDNATGITALNGAVNDLINVVSAGGQVITQIVELTVPLTLTGTNQKITFDTLQKASNDITVIDVDTSDGNDHILKSTNTAGFLNVGNFAFTSTAGFFTTSTCVLDLYLDGVLQDSLTINAGFGETNNAIKQCDCVLATQPQTLTVEARVTAGSGTLDSGTLRTASNFTSTGGVPGPSTTAVTTLSSSATESPSGTQTVQQGANEEFTSILKEAGKVLTATYVSDGKFKYDSDNAIASGNKYSFILPDEGTGDAEFSVDNGTTYYDLNYINENDGTVYQLQAEDIQNLLIDFYFDGSNFIVTSITAPISNTQTQTARVGSTYGTLAPIKGAPQLALEGLSLEQVVSNGDTASSVTSNTFNERISLNTDGSVAITPNYDATDQVFSIVSGNQYYIRIKLDPSSVGTINDRVYLWYSDNSFDFEGATGTNKTDISYIITATKTLSANLKFPSSGNGQIDKTEWTMIDLGTNPLSLTASQLDAMALAYFEGRKDTVNPQVKFVGKNLFDKNTNILVDKNLNSSGQEQTAVGSFMTDDYISVKQGTTYIGPTENSTNLRLAQYDSEYNFIKLTSVTSTTITVTLEDNTTFIRISSGAYEDIDTLQLEEGTSATDYEEHNTQEITFQETFRSVGDVRDKAYFKDDDYVKEKNVDRDYNDVVQSATSWTPQLELTNTIVFRKDLTGSLNYKVPASSATQTNTYLSLADNIIPTNNVTYLATNDEEGVGISDNNDLFIRILKSKLSGITSSDFETYIQANDVEFIFELDESTTTVIDTDGSTLQDTVTTVSQSQDIPCKLEITYALNSSKQTETNTQSIAHLQEEIDELETGKVDVDGAKVLSDNNYDDTDKDKVAHITITQDVDLDTIESDVSTNTSNISTNEDNISTNTGNISTNTNDITSIETKTDYITVSANINLNKVWEYTELLSSKVSVSSSTTEPSPNITLSSGISNFDKILIVFERRNRFGSVLANADTLTLLYPSADSGLTDSSDERIKFKLFKKTDTTMVAFFGRIITYGSSYTTNLTSLIDIKQIYGINC